MPWNTHTHWRDTKAWIDFGFPLSTSSDEAAKMFDAIITQHTGSYEEDEVGGIKEATERMLKADPDFVMGHVITTWGQLAAYGTSCRLDPKVQNKVDSVLQLASKSDLHPQEKLHVTALEALSKEHFEEATLLYEDILAANPLDSLAMKAAYFGNFFQGKKAQLRDTVARAMPAWKPHMPLYSFLFGLHSFGLCETNMYQEAEKNGKKGLELNSRDPWATHSLCHVMEMQGRQDEGVKLLSSTVKDWTSRSMLTCHTYWHWALYHIEKGNFEAALDVYDSEIGTRAKANDSVFQMSDACALLHRLELQDVNVGDRWHDIYEVCRPHEHDHIQPFNDVHIMMAVLGDNQKEASEMIMESMKEVISVPQTSTHELYRRVCIPVHAAMIAYHKEDYSKAVDLMMPVRYNVVELGGSDAQRDVFSQFLICACLKSSRKDHNKLARGLLAERKALRENSPLTDRLMSRAMAQHID